MRTVTMLALLFGMTLPLRAQSPTAPPDTAKQFQFNFRFRFSFSPERAIANQHELGLSESQRNILRTEVRRAQAMFGDLQRRLDEKQMRLTSLLERPLVDEAAVLAMLDEILAYEAELKRLQLRLLIRTKNALTPAQQRRLTDPRGSDS